MGEEGGPEVEAEPKVKEQKEGCKQEAQRAEKCGQQQQQQQHQGAWKSGPDEADGRHSRRHHFHRFGLERDELVYVRLETIGAKITDLSTQAINERLLASLVSILFTDDGQHRAASRGEANGTAAAAATKASRLSAELEQLGAQMRAQILDSPPGEEGQRQAQKCRLAMERTLCRFVYPSCHFRRADVSALVRPPCREDCQLLRDLYCPNVDLGQFARLLRLAISETLRGELNELSLAVEGATGDLLAGAEALSRPGQSSADDGHATHLGPTSEGQTKNGSTANAQLRHSRAWGDELGRNLAERQIIDRASMHLYWPHERLLGECESLPALRAGAAQSALNGSLAARPASANHLLHPNVTTPKNATTTTTTTTSTSTNSTLGEETRLDHRRRRRRRSKGSQTASGPARWTSGNLWRWRQRQATRNKWPICSNARLAMVAHSSAGLTKAAAHNPRIAQGNPMGQLGQKGEGASDSARAGLRLECLQSDDGVDYFGTKNSTLTGLACQAWRLQEPHKHKSTELLFDNMWNAHNYCRNPGGLRRRPWCYTVAPDVRWQYCQLDACQPK